MDSTQRREEGVALGGEMRRPSPSETLMPSRLQRLALLTVLLSAPLLGVAAPAQAAGPAKVAGPAKAAGGQVDGSASFDVVACPGPPPGFEAFIDYPGLLMTGDLKGCLYTNVEQMNRNPAEEDGVYIERGQEVFVGSLNGGPTGTFTTTYRFQGKYADGVELFGRCQHPIVDGSGTEGFEGATGRLDFKDIIIGDTVTYVYRGHIRLR